MSDYLDFGDVARQQCGMQCQYASRYVGGRHGFPDLSQGLRFEGDPKNYHDLTIHKDDVAEFVRRVQAHHRVFDEAGKRRGPS